MGKTNRIQDHLKYIICAFFSSLSLCMSNTMYELSPEQIKQLGSNIEISCWKLMNSIHSPSYLICIVAILLYFAYCYLGSKLDKKYLFWGIPLSVLSSLIVLLCESYYITNTWNNVFGNITALSLSIIKGIGITILFLFIFGYIQSLRFRQIDQVLKSKVTKKYFFKTMGILLFCWIPYMVILFPGCMNPDTRDQIAQITRNVDLCWTAQTILLKSSSVILNNHHPVFYTWLISIFITIGKHIGSYAWGLELYCITQCIGLSATFSGFLIYIRKKGVPERLCKWITIFFALNPIFPIYGMTVMKDVPFSILILIAIIMIYEALKHPEKLTPVYMTILMLVLLVWMLLRNNGFYILIVLIPFIIGILWKSKKYLGKFLISFLIPMLIFQIGIQGFLFPALKISSGSVREMLSIPFQQTARYIQEYGDTLSTEEKDIILKVFNTPNHSVNDLAQQYVPDRADIIKSWYNKNTSKNDLKNYLKVWANGLIHHPNVYIQAFLNLNYSWFSFDSKQDNIYYNGITDKNIQKMLPDVENPKFLSPIRQILSYFIGSLSRIPFTSWIVEFSFYTWVYLLAFILMFVRKKYKELLATGMLYINYLICFIGPVAYMRYAIPMIVCLPFLLILTFMDEIRTTPSIY